MAGPGLGHVCRSECPGTGGHHFYPDSSQVDHSNKEQSPQELPGCGVLHHTGKYIIKFSLVLRSYILKVELFGTKAHTTDYLGAGLIVLAVLGIAVEDRVVKRLREKFAYI